MTRSVGAMLCLVVFLAASSTAADSDCFRREDNRRLSYDVVMISGPPPFSPQSGDYVEAFATYPASDYATMSLRTIATESPKSRSGLEFRKHFLLWTNRCIYMEGITPDPSQCRNVRRTKGNGYPGMTTGPLEGQLRTAFSTYRRANACTSISALRVLGEDEAILKKMAASEGLDLVTRRITRNELQPLARRVTTASGAPATYLVDICIVEPTPMAGDSAGILLDYEVWDDRTPAEATAYLKRLQELVAGKGKTLIVATNPLPRAPNGMDASNAAAVLSMVDGFAPTIATGGSTNVPDIGLAARPRKHTPWEAYKEQLRILTANGRIQLTPELKRKLWWNISLYDLALPEARQLHEEIVRQGYRGIMVSRIFVKQGGVCGRPENQVIACLTLGECHGSFGSKR